MFFSDRVTLITISTNTLLAEGDRIGGHAPAVSAISTNTLLAEGDRYFYLAEKASQFQPTPSSRRVTTLSGILLGCHLFQPTPSSRRVTHFQRHPCGF